MRFSAVVVFSSWSASHSRSGTLSCRYARYPCGVMRVLWGPPRVAISSFIDPLERRPRVEHFAHMMVATVDKECLRAE